MRKMLIVTGIAAVIAALASAQSYSASYGTGNVINLPALEHGGDFAAGTPNSAYANAPEGAAARRLHNISAEALSPSDPDTVYEAGQYVGRDPDPNVRLELRRDWAHDKG